MNVNFYYVQSGSTMPTTYVEGAVYFDSNTKKIYRAKSTYEIEDFVPSEEGVSIEDSLTSTSTTSALSANQGNVLKGITDVKADKTELIGKAGTKTGAEVFNNPDNVASGRYSHAEGDGTTASGLSSHAEGSGTTAQNQSEHAEGKHNKSNKANETFGNAGNTIHSVGIGTSNSARKNAFEIMQNGDAYLCGLGGYDGTNPNTEGVNSIQSEISNKVTAAQVNAMFSYDAATQTLSITTLS